MKKPCSNNSASRGQSVAEYAILIALISMAIAGMQLYAKRGIQAGVKVAADQLSPIAGDADGSKAQLAGIRYESGDRSNSVVAEGSVLNRASASTSKKTQVAETSTTEGGGVERIVNESNSVSGALAGGASSQSEVIIDVR